MEARKWAARSETPTYSQATNPDLIANDIAGGHYFKSIAHIGGGRDWEILEAFAGGNKDDVLQAIGQALREANQSMDKAKKENAGKEPPVSYSLVDISVDGIFRRAPAILREIVQGQAVEAQRNKSTPDR